MFFLIKYLLNKDTVKKTENFFVFLIFFNLKKVRENMNKK
jgi:hypothetical protein